MNIFIKKKKRKNKLTITAAIRKLGLNWKSVHINVELTVSL
jgi:hypothetical protein